MNNTMSLNEIVAVNFLRKNNLLNVIEKEDFNLQNVVINSFATETPLTFFTNPQRFNASNCVKDFEKYLTKYFSKEKAKKIAKMAVIRNISYNTCYMRNDLMLNVNGKIYVIEWNDVATHYGCSNFYDYISRTFSDFIKHKVFANVPEVTYLEVKLCGTRAKKDNKIKQTLGKILKGSL